MPGQQADVRRATTFGRLEAAMLLIVLTLSLLASAADYVSLERSLGLFQTQANGDEYREKVAAKRARDSRSSWLARQYWWLERALEHAAPMLVIATIGAGATAAARLRAGHRRSIRGAGEITIVALAPWLTVAVLNEFLARRFPKTSWGYGPTFHIWSDVADPIGGAIVALWFLLWCGRSWRAEPAWRDRLGRTVAVAWLGYAAVRTFLFPWTAGN